VTDLRGNHLFIRISDPSGPCSYPDLCKDQCRCRVPIYCLPCIKAYRHEGKAQRDELRKQRTQKRVEKEREEMIANKRARQQAQLEEARQNKIIADQKQSKELNDCKVRRQPLMDSMIETLNQMGSKKCNITDVVGNISYLYGYYDCITIQFKLRQVTYTFSFTLEPRANWKISIRLIDSQYDTILRTTCPPDHLQTLSEIQTYITHLVAILPY
jgi:hypothetical protein